MADTQGVCRNCCAYPVRKSDKTCSKCGTAYPYMQTIPRRSLMKRLGLWGAVSGVALLTTAIVMGLM